MEKAPKRTIGALLAKGRKERFLSHGFDLLAEGERFLNQRTQEENAKLLEATPAGEKDAAAGIAAAENASDRIAAAKNALAGNAAAKIATVDTLPCPIAQNSQASAGEGAHEGHVAGGIPGRLDDAAAVPDAFPRHAQPCEGKASLGKTETVPGGKGICEEAMGANPRGAVDFQIGAESRLSKAEADRVSGVGSGSQSEAVPVSGEAFQNPDATRQAFIAQDAVAECAIEKNAIAGAASNAMAKSSSVTGMPLAGASDAPNQLSREVRSSVSSASPTSSGNLPEMPAGVQFATARASVSLPAEFLSSKQELYPAMDKQEPSSAIGEQGSPLITGEQEVASGANKSSWANPLPQRAGQVPYSPAAEEAFSGSSRPHVSGVSQTHVPLETVGQWVHEESRGGVNFATAKNVHLQAVLNTPGAKNAGAEIALEGNAGAGDAMAKEAEAKNAAARNAAEMPADLDKIINVGTFAAGILTPGNNRATAGAAAISGRPFVPTASVAGAQETWESGPTALMPIGSPATLEPPPGAFQDKQGTSAVSQATSKGAAKEASVSGNNKTSEVFAAFGKISAQPAVSASNDSVSTGHKLPISSASEDFSTPIKTPKTREGRVPVSPSRVPAPVSVPVGGAWRTEGGLELPQMPKAREPMPQNSGNPIGASAMGSLKTHLNSREYGVGEPDEMALLAQEEAKVAAAQAAALIATAKNAMAKITKAEDAKALAALAKVAMAEIAQAKANAKDMAEVFAKKREKARLAAEQARAKFATGAPETPFCQPSGTDRNSLQAFLANCFSHTLSPTAFVTYAYLHHRRNTMGGNALGLNEIAAATGLSKRTVQGNLKELVQADLVQLHRAHITATATYAIR